MTAPSDNPTPAPAPSSNPKRGHGDIERGLLDDIQTGRDVLAAAKNPDYNTAILTRVKPAVLTRLDGNLKTAADDPDQNLIKDVINTKKAAAVATQEESGCYDNLMAALRLIQKAAGDTYKKDKARRAAYLIGKRDFGDNRATLEADASAIIALAKADTAVGFLPADLTSAQTALDDWKQANSDQRHAQDNYSHAVQALRDIVAPINDDRRTVQADVDILYPAKPASNAPTRRAFGLLANRPMKV